MRFFELLMDKSTGSLSSSSNPWTGNDNESQVGERRSESGGGQLDDTSAVVDGKSRG